MTTAPRPPRLTRLLLGRALPNDVRETIVADLDEIFDRDRRTCGVSSARWTYRRRVLSFAARFLVERVADRARGGISSMDVKLGCRLPRPRSLRRHPRSPASPPCSGARSVDADERSGAPAVVVLGYDVWQSRFHGDPATIGRAVPLRVQPAEALRVDAQ